MSNVLESVMRLTDEYTATMQKIIQASDAYEKKQQEAQKVTETFKASMKGVQNSSNSATSGIGAVTAKITGLVSAAYLGKKAIDLMFSAIKLGATEQVQLTSFQSLLGSQKVGTALNDYVKAYASQSALGFKDLASATTSWLAFTHNTNQIEQLNKLVERLYAKNPEQGAEGAVFALKEILTGQTQSIKDRFNMNGISADTITKLNQKGDINGTIKYLDQEFNRFGATQGIVTANFNSLTMGFERFKTNFMQGMADESTPAVQNLSLVMQQLNSDMSAGKFQPFFALMANGAAQIANGIAWITENMQTVAPVVVGVGTALIGFTVAMNAASLASAIFGATASSIVGGAFAVAATVAAIAAGVATLNGVMNSATSKTGDTTKSLAEAKAAASKAMSGAGVTKVPVEVSNKSPISVKGQVEIEKESQKYLFDLAAQKAIAQFSLVSNTPSVIIQNQNVSKSADLEEINQALGDLVYQNSGTQPQGGYK